MDADGLALSPGFIDMHAHSDLALLRDPDHAAKAAQGVTLEVLGQDGLSYAPVDDRTLAQIRTAITGWNGDGSDIDFTWRTVGEFLDRLDHGFDGQGIAVNAAYLIPQGAVRMLALGWEDRDATPAEVDAGDRAEWGDDRPYADGDGRGDEAVQPGAGHDQSDRGEHCGRCGGLDELASDLAAGTRTGRLHP